MQEECSDGAPQGWSSVWINISTLGLCLLIGAVISTHATPGRQALMMLVPPCPAKAFPQRHAPKSRACELWDKTLTALESVVHVTFFPAANWVWCLPSAGPKDVDGILGLKPNCLAEDVKKKSFLTLKMILVEVQNWFTRLKHYSNCYNYGHFKH